MTKQMINQHLLDLKEKVKDNTVFILGHKIVDVDSYVSMIFIEKLLKRYEINAKASLLIKEEDIDKYTIETVEGLKCQQIKREQLSTSDLFFLVDHNNQEESLKELKVENIVGIIDHHEDEKLFAGFKVIETAGSTTKIIYEIFKSLDIELSSDEEIQILLSLLIDTNFLMSTKTNESDIIFANSFLKEFGLKIEDLKEKYLIPTDLELPIKKLSLNGLKEYKIEDKIVKSSYIEYFNDKKEEVYFKINEIYSEINKEEYDLFVLILKDLSKGETEVILWNKKENNIPNINYNQIASRGKTIIPFIREQIVSGGILL